MSLIHQLYGLGYAETPPPRPLFWEHEGNRAVGRPDGGGDWKLVAAAGEQWELYDLRVDRTEQHDLAGQMPERVAELSALWDEWAAANDVLPLGGWKGRQEPRRGRTR